MKLSQKAAVNTTRVIVMGLSGTGKSTLTSELTKEFNLKWFTLDNDSDILLKLPLEQQERIELFDLPDSATFPVAADTLMKLFRSKKGDICHAHGVFSCVACKKQGDPSLYTEIDFTTLDPKKDVVVIDTGSQLSHSILAKATKDKPVDYKPERDDWGALRKWTEFFYSEFQAARFNLVVIFHAIEVEMEDGKFKLVPSFGSKDMSSKIAGAFSHVVYTDIVNKKHKAFCKSTESSAFLTKSRTDFDISKFDPPSLIAIFKGTVPAEVKTPTDAGHGTKAAVDLKDIVAKMKAQQAAQGEKK